MLTAFLDKVRTEGPGPSNSSWASSGRWSGCSKSPGYEKLLAKIEAIFKAKKNCSQQLTAAGNNFL